MASAPRTLISEQKARDETTGFLRGCIGDFQCHAENGYDEQRDAQLGLRFKGDAPFPTDVTDGVCHDLIPGMIDRDREQAQELMACQCHLILVSHNLMSWIQSPLQPLRCIARSFARRYECAGTRI